ncbi:hypothetical protein [Cupriavidus sp. H18C2]|uniref:hypothetical protein n=1 Tax=Cupriavidus sp. H18C2 TaxID=3241602 RepID=UPI003BF78AEF
MKQVFLLALACLAGAAHAQSTVGAVAAPLGLELGKTQCARLTPGPNREKTGKTPWAGGDAFELRHLDRFNLPGLTRAVVNCDAQDLVTLVTLTFDRTALDDVTHKLDARYESKRKTDANAQNAYAEWAAANGTLELLYARDGKQFTVAYWGKGAKARYFAYGSNPDKAPAASAAPAPAKVPAAL